MTSVLIGLEMASMQGISEYWERLFDPDEGRLKEQLEDEYEVLDCHLFIIDCVSGTRGVGHSAVEQTIDVVE